MAVRRSTVALLFLTGLAAEAAGLDGCAHHRLDSSPGGSDVARAVGATRDSSSHRSLPDESSPDKSSRDESSPHEQTAPGSSSPHDHGEEAPCCCVDHCVCAFDSPGADTSVTRRGERAERSSPEPAGATGTTRRAPSYLQPPANAPPLLSDWLYHTRRPSPSTPSPPRGPTREGKTRCGYTGFFDRMPEDIWLLPRLSEPACVRVKPRHRKSMCTRTAPRTCTRGSTSPTR